MIKKILAQELQRQLFGRASDLLIQRLVKTIDETEPGAEAMKETLSRIRVAIKLFVSEKLSEYVYTELCNKAGLK